MRMQVTAAWRTHELCRSQSTNRIPSSPQGIVPIQISREPPGERHHRALQEFYEAFPHALEAVLVGPEAYEAGVLERLVQT